LDCRGCRPFREGVGIHASDQPAEPMTMRTLWLATLLITVLIVVDYVWLAG
jgi:hypothetical protein